jgi:hypothetical protein
MFKRLIGFGVGFSILLMVSADLPSALADGLPPEEALPTATAEEFDPILAEEITEPEAAAEEAIAEPSPKPSPKPLAKPLPKTLAKEISRPIAKEKSSKADLWSSVFHGTILSEPKTDGKIIGSKDQKSMLGEGDTVYLVSLNEEFIPGKEWIVYKIAKNVYHPKTGQYLGDLVDVTGIVKIIEVDKKMATAQITRSKEPIFKEDKIALVETLFDPSVPPNRSLPEGMTATVVEARDGRRNNATLDIVYIDRGKKDGVLPGDRFDVITGGQQIGTHSDGQALRSPEREVGSIVILTSQEHTATGQIIKSSEPVSKGNPLLFHFLK